MKKIYNKLTNLVIKVLNTKFGKFLFEVINTIGLLVLTIYMFYHVKLLLGSVCTFFLFSNIVLLINKYRNNEQDNN